MDISPFGGILTVTLVILFAYVLEIVMQHFWIIKQHNMKIEQVTKMYGPSWHDKAKMGTPSMGGVVFIPVLIIVAFTVALFLNFPLGRVALYISFPILASLVGFIDDWLKHSSNSSEGLRSMQKLALQIAATVSWAFFAIQEPMPLIAWVVIPRWFAIVLVSFFGIGIQNAVNVTDGLDGLASGTSCISFIAAMFFAATEPVSLLVCSAAVGICLGFLWHNANPAKVFMGDCGSHFLGALLFSVCVCSGVTILIIPLAFIFGIEIISVSIQIFAIRVLHRKVFLMSPIHHHFELLGWKENQVVVRMCIAHLLGMLVLSSLILILASLLH